MNYEEIITRKIYTSESIRKQLAAWKFLGNKIVFTNGCFDLIHMGHVDYLSKAAGLGNILIVGINSDTSVSKLKGPSRPVNDQQSRLRIMASFLFVSAVILFDEDTPLELIKNIEPDVLVKGGDYEPEKIAGYDVVKARGGNVITLPFIEGYSSSLMEKKIRESTR